MANDNVSEAVKSFLSERGRGSGEINATERLVLGSLDYVALLLHTESTLNAKIDDGVFLSEGLPETFGDVCERLAEASSQEAISRPSGTNTPAGTLRELFLHTVSVAPQASFLANAQSNLTYDDVYRLAGQRANFLTDVGIDPGERVFIVNEDPLNTSLWILACVLTGAVFVVLHRDTSPQRMRYLLNDATPAGVIDPGRARFEVYKSSSHLRFAVTAEGVADSLAVWDGAETVCLAENDLAFLVYTSGSTGRPKGIVCPHRNVLAATSSINAFLHNEAHDRIGHLLPLSFDYGLYQIFLAMQARACVVFLGQFHSAIELVNQLRELRITGFPAMRSVLVPLSRLSAAECDTEHLRYISSTGDYLPPTLLDKMKTNFPKVQFFSMYGLSECKRALYMPPERLTSKPQSVGQPIPGTRAYVMDERQHVLPPGRVGELVVEGPHVMSGYWNAPEETSVRFVQGPDGKAHLRTGDLFFQDLEGDFHFVARPSDVIKSKGFRLSPKEVESAVLDANPLVKECVAYGVDDDLLGQAIHAEVVVDDKNCTVTDIFANCRKKMESYLVPTKIRIVDMLAKTSSGKYSRGVVLE